MARNNHKRISVSRILTPVALAITLAACSSKPVEPEYVDITSTPEKSVQAYLIKADSSKGSIQNDWLIMALKASIENGDTQQSSLIISRLEKQKLSAEQKAEWLILKARYNLQMNRPEVALQQLYFEPFWDLTNAQWQTYHTIRTEAFEMVGNYFSASKELSKLYELSTDDEKPLISERIWEYLSQYSEIDLNNFISDTSDWVMTGWLELALYMESYGDNVIELQPKLKAWMENNPDHPAFTYPPQNIAEVLALEIAKPESTALLLPLTGKYAKAAQVVRDGFLLALLEDPNRAEDAILTVIDTNKYSVEEIDAKLSEQKVDFIVGPLVKSEIEQIQQLQESKENPVPMLALNLPDTPTETTDACYLTLSPEQEVAQAAVYLTEQGFQYPLILAPKGALGERVAEAFKTEWQKSNKTDVAVSLFSSKAQLQQNIDSVFGLKESQARIVQMDKLLGIETENQTRSRRDIDAVYIVAKSSELTLIKPFIEVAINPEATPPMLFASSRSNNSNKRFEDFTGIVYSDIPMLIEQDEALSSQLAEIWPEQSKGQKRLQALGMDAYQLIDELPKLKVVPDYQVKGQTGVLSMGEQCIIQRKISWAQFDAL